MWTVVIDAGHGGKSSRSPRLNKQEKNINTAIALKAGEYIKQNVKNARVLYTRNNDVFVEVKERQNLPIRIKLTCLYRYMPTGQARKRKRCEKLNNGGWQKTRKTLKLP